MNRRRLTIAALVPLVLGGGSPACKERNPDRVETGVQAVLAD